MHHNKRPSNLTHQKNVFLNIQPLKLSRRIPKYVKNQKVCQKHENFLNIWKFVKQLKFFQKTENLSKVWRKKINIWKVVDVDVDVDIVDVDSVNVDTVDIDTVNVNTVDELSSDESYQVMKVIKWWKLSSEESYQLRKLCSEESNLVMKVI